MQISLYFELKITNFNLFQGLRGERDKGKGKNKGKMYLETFLSEVARVLKIQDGSSLSKLLKISLGDRTNIHNVSMMQMELDEISATKHSMEITIPDQVWKKTVNIFENQGIGIGESQNYQDNQSHNLSQWKGIIEGHLRVLLKIYHGLVEDTFKEQLNTIQIFSRILSTMTRWVLPVLYVLMEDLWKLASEDVKRMEESARTINKLFTICITDRNLDMSISRRWGTIKLAGFLFRIYFHIWQLNLCNNVLRAMETADLPKGELFPAGEEVTWRFMIGKYHFINENYESAEVELSRAWSRCLKRDEASKKNARLILHYLIPTKMYLRGLAPSNQLLEEYGMHPFYSQLKSILSSGNIGKFEKLIEEHMSDLIVFGI